MNKLPAEIICKILSFVLYEYPLSIVSFQKACKHHDALVNQWHPFRTLCALRRYSMAVNKSENIKISVDFHLVDAELAVLPLLHNMHMHSNDQLNNAVIRDEDNDANINLRGHISDMTQQTLGRIRNSSETRELSETSIENSPTQILIAADWKKLFIENWQQETSLSRGKCIVSGTLVKFGTMGTMQTFANSIYGAFNNTISVWDIATGDAMLKLSGHTEGITVLQVDEQFLVSASFDKCVRVWSSVTGALLNVCELDAVVRSLRFNNIEIVAGDSTGNVYVIDLLSAKIVTKITGKHTQEVSQLQFDHRWICSASADKTVQVFNRLNQRILFFDGSCGSFVSAMCMNRDWLCVGTVSGKLFMWELRPADEQYSQAENYDRVLSEVLRMDVCQDGLSNDSGQMSLGHMETVNCVQLLVQDGSTTIFSASSDGTVKAWRYSAKNASFECLYTLEHDVPILCAEIAVQHSDDKHVKLSLAGLDGMLHDWDVSLFESDKYHLVKKGVRHTFASSFLPIVRYQDFMQILLDRPARPNNNNQMNTEDHEEEMSSNLSLDDMLQ